MTGLGSGLFEGVGIALASLRASKARAALTILGVAIGVMVVMLMAAMISGINKSVAGVFESIAPQTFLVWRFFQAGVNVSDGSDENSPWRRNPPIDELEADRIRLLPSVRYVTRREESSANVEFGALRLESVQISGLSAEWVEVNGGDVHPGRTFTRLEDLSNRAVAVINRSNGSGKATRPIDPACSDRRRDGKSASACRTHPARGRRRSAGRTCRCEPRRATTFA